MRRLIVPVAIVLALATAVGFAFLRLAPDRPPPVADAERATTEVIDLTRPPPAPPGPRAVEIAGGAGRIIPVAGPEDRTLSEEGLRQAVDFAERTGTEALLVWQGGALQLEYYGPGTEPFDRLEGRGLQAGLMALLAGLARQDGHIVSFDDPLSAWLPEWRDDRRGRITLRQLLLGTSGLDRPAAAPPPHGVADVEAWTLSAGLAAAPDSRFEPNLMEIQVLGLVLSRATGRAFQDFLSEALWQPMGARTARMRIGADGVPMLACCFSASARDWLRLGLLMVERGVVGERQLLPAPWLDEMARPIPQSRNDGIRLRLAWPHDPAGPIRASQPFREPDTIFIAGDGGQRLYVSPGADLVVLRLGRAVADWDESALPNLISAHLDVPPPLERTGGRDLSGLALPPITKPPPVPEVEAVPLEP